MVTVTSAADSGAGTLRDAVQNATSGTIIKVQAGIGPIQLNTPIFLGLGPNGLPNGATNITIDGAVPGQNNTTVSGQQKTTMFVVVAGSDFLNNLILTEGKGGNGTGTSANGGAVAVMPGATLGMSGDNLNNNNTQQHNGGAIENDGNLTISGCTFDTNAATSDNNGNFGSGGAIENTGILNVNGVASTFKNNRAGLGGQGGAIDSNGSGWVNVSFATFFNNTAAQGGAIATTTNTTLKNDTFGTGANQGNYAINALTSGGGAVFAQNKTSNNRSLTVLACQFNNNSTDTKYNGENAGNPGGAISAGNYNTDVEQSTFNQNSATYSFGGAMSISAGGKNAPAVITQEFNLDTFSNNNAESGGAISVNNGGASTSVNLYLYNSTFANNSVANKGGGKGGAVYLSDVLSGAGSVANTLTNDTFFNNKSDFDGGALNLALFTSGTGPVTAALTSLTVNQNTATNEGGGLFINSKIAKAVTLDNNILIGNTAQGEAAQDVTQNNAGVLNDGGYNLLGTSDNNNFTNGVNNDVLSDPAKSGLAAQLAANGAPATYPQTLALTAQKGAGSPGYETGDQTLAAKGTGAPLNQDERGMTRQANSVSMGAEDPDAKFMPAVKVGASADPALPNQPVTLTATVTSVGGTPTGTMTFYDGSTELGTSTLDGNGNASYTTSSLSLGSHSITAQYSGDSNFDASSGSMTEVVSQEASDFMSLYSSASAGATLNQAITFTASVSGSSGTPTGVVTFLDGTTVLGTGTLDGNGNATLTTSTLTLGNHTIIAVYGGDATYADDSASFTQSVNQGADSVSVIADNNPAQPGQQVNFTATVMPEAGTIAPTGTVTFLDGTTTLGTGTLALVNGQYQATFSTSSLASGSHVITAFYSGDDVFAPNSGSMNETVGQASGAGSTTSLTSSANSSTLNQSITFTATVYGGSGTPTGTVTFLDDGTVLGTATVDASGTATLTTSTFALDFGASNVLAVYSGDSTYAASAAALTQLVSEAGTSSYVSTSANPSPSGQMVTFTSSIGWNPNAGTPTGTVSYYDGTTLLGTATLSVVNGQVQATFSTSAMGLGSHNIIAVYSGDGIFADSESSLTQTISS